MKKQLLDPIGTMCKLVSLIFCDRCTKISIQDHVLILQTPSGYQFLVRMYNGDGRENISELYYVIIRLIKWYIVPRYELINNNNTNMSSDTNVVNDLSSVKINDTIVFDKEDEDDENDVSDKSEDNDDTDDIDDKKNDDENKSKMIVVSDYLTGSNDSKNKSNSVEHNSKSALEISTSDEFIKMINYMCDAFSKLQETYEYGNVVLALQYYINLLKDAINGKYTDDQLPKYILEKDKEYENLIDYNKLKNLWDVEKIKRINQLYDDCMNLTKDSKLSEKTRDSLIKGNLRSIYSILDDSDIEFQKLIQNSNRG